MASGSGTLFSGWNDGGFGFFAADFGPPEVMVSAGFVVRYLVTKMDVHSARELLIYGIYMAYACIACWKCCIPYFLLEVSMTGATEQKYCNKNGNDF